MPKTFISTNIGVMARGNRRHEWFSRNRLTLTGDIIAGTKCAPATGKDKHSDRIVHLRLGNGLDQISLYRVSQTIQSLGRVELNPSDTRLSQ